MEIKRYGLGQGKLSSDSGVSVYGPQIVELDGGEYYKASDVDEYLESIGAGGVSGRITSKTLEQHRVEFEEWHKGNMWSSTPNEEEYYIDDDGYYLNLDVQVAWLGFQAAKGIKEIKE